MLVKRRAYILIFVLGVTTVVTALGLSYISSNGTVMQQATNRYAAVRAQYVAESGAALANHFIHYPPSTVAYNGVYAGATNVAIDSTYDTVDIRVTPTTPANRYVVQTTSVVRNALGTESLAKQSIRMDSIVPPEPKWKVSQGLLLTAGGTISSGVTISGAVHANGALIGLGNCTGAVSSSQTVVWTGGGPPTSVRSLQPLVTAPPVTTSLYATYKINHKSYTAYTGYSASDMTKGDAATLNSTVNSSGTNPGRIVWAPVGDFKIKADAAFNGTLIIRGDLVIDGKSVIFQSASDFPALVVTGSIYSKSDGNDATITGSVICGGDVRDDGRKNVAIVINGAAVVGGTVSCTGSGSTIKIVWSAANSTFWNLAKTANPEPYTVLEWQEN